MPNAIPSMGSGFRRIVRVGGIAALVAIALVGCRQSEQGRVLWYQQGTFKGAQLSTPLSQADLANLRERTQRQAGDTIGSSSEGVSGMAGGNPLTGTDVRLPARYTE